MAKNEIAEVRAGYPDCCFSVKGNWFRYRAGAIIIEDNSFLVMKSESTNHFYTVGGGVHMNETTEECIAREVKEETDADYEIERLAVICENFFNGIGSLKDLNCHTLEFYFLMKSRGNKNLKCKSNGWDQAKEELYWIPLDELPNANIKPDFLKTRMKEILESKNILHIVNDER